MRRMDSPPAEKSLISRRTSGEIRGRRSRPRSKSGQVFLTQSRMVACAGVAIAERATVSGEQAAHALPVRFSSSARMAVTKLAI